MARQHWEQRSDTGQVIITDCQWIPEFLFDFRYIFPAPLIVLLLWSEKQQNSKNIYKYIISFFSNYNENKNGDTSIVLTKIVNVLQNPKLTLFQQIEERMNKRSMGNDVHLFIIL